ncbi:Crp/Fnr family transcriptional regulator [Sphingomonas sp. R1]|uniref:Crp/Fnr family transcriptional regulator n=1 Tax=Sphingomonas sp. R1 TaxID=399176 RepID=UPI0022250E54|nr:Crp/Fnr family transcriptional regulator [Sphingomonas sp. R1]UYY76024.1 Crp/Fnr family transcriptional regulator [Sphingomonas sp. R1]
MGALSDIDLATRFACLFACSEAVAAELTAAATVRWHAPGPALVRQGEQCGRILVLLEGHARAAMVTLDGRVLQVAEHHPGDIFGGVDPSREQAAEVTVATPSLIASFATADFYALAERHACVGVVLARTMVRQFGALTQLVSARLTLSATGRVHAELLRMAQAGDGRWIRPLPVLSDLALRVQTARETVSRAVSALERRGIVCRHDDGLEIVAPARLEALIV